MLFGIAAAERVARVLCGWGAQWVSWCEFFAGASGVGVCRTSGPQDMLYWAPSSFRARLRKISIKGWIQPTAFNRLPLSRRNSPTFWIKWKTEPSFHPQYTTNSPRWWFIMKWMQEAGLWKCPCHLTVCPSHKLFPFEADQECGEISLHTSLIRFCLLNWVDFNKQFKVTYQLNVALRA